MIDKFLVGSKALNLSNPRDCDYIVIADTYDDVKKIKHTAENENLRNDYHVKTIETFKRMSEMNSMDSHMMLSYQLDKKINNESPCSLCLFEHTEKLKSFLKTIVERNGFFINPHFVEMWKKNKVPKIRYHLVYNWFLLRNMDYKLSDTQQKVIERIHAKDMPMDFSFEFNDKITKWIFENYPEGDDEEWLKKYII